MSIWKQDYELMLHLRDFATTYCTFVEAGGKCGDISDALINKAIAISMQIKENRDYIDKALGHCIPSVKEECETAMSILNGTYQEDRLSSVVLRII